MMKVNGNNGVGNNYEFEVLDVRPIPVAKENNEKIFNRKNILGIEVTRKELAERCDLGNVDPQHSEGKNEAAIEAAMKVDLPESGATLVTLMTDLDSVGAMAVIDLRAQGVKIDQFAGKIEEIARADCFARGQWKSVPMPSRENLWPAANAGVSDLKSLAPIAEYVRDFRIPIGERVMVVKVWLMTGEEPEGLRQRVEQERLKLVGEISSGELKIVEDNGIAIVQHPTRPYSMLGYSLAPVVVSLNEKFSFQGCQPYRKFTISQYSNSYIDFTQMWGDLNQLEPGWGGSPTIGGSPQGKSSHLGLNQLLEVIRKNKR